MSLAAALRTRDLGELPRKRDSAWHYTDLRAAISALPPPSPEAEPFGISPFAGIPGEAIVFVNGRRLDAGRVPQPDSADSADSSHHPDSADSPDSPDSPDSSHHPDSVDSVDSVLILAAPDGAHSAHLVHCRFLSDANGTAHAAHLLLTVTAGARAVLLESHEGRGGAYVSDVRLDISLGEGARLERIVITDEPADAVSVATCHVAVEGEAHFAQTVLASGARLQRVETDVRHPGAAARVRLDGVYLLGERRHADLTSVVDHEGPGGATAQLTKGVVAGQGRGVFQGRITVRAGADGTDARMGHHALLLSDRAEVDAKPELEIWADDVQCAHGNTVGALDADALFYAMSRGLPEPDARAMLTEAFVGEVVARIEHAGAREAAEAWVATRLRALR